MSSHVFGAPGGPGKALAQKWMHIYKKYNKII